MKSPIFSRWSHDRCEEFGTLTVGERPTALGIACLKLPAEVHLARLVVLGWTMDMGPSACVLAAALSLTPSCDVFLTPMNTQGARDAARLQHQWLRHVFKERTSHFFLPTSDFLLAADDLVVLKFGEIAQCWS
ncbi:unnamed protein product [Cladocopium goreaui]|uniref:RNA helicase n=1 Tax=Cladocopium goreaui TaxID=2562237 RepID=A0A9P1DLV4_9DINO|nr:unnamed protein product [Cladocopium goreaui]